MSRHSDFPVSRSISVRKISNGFVATHSHSTADGEYHSHEVFHEKKPVLEFSPEAGQNRTASARPQNILASAARHIDRKVR